MFICKHKNGFFYVYHEGSNGERKRVSTKSKLKSKANEFLSRFQQELKLRAERKPNPISLSEFRMEILKHSESVHNPKTTSNYQTSFKAPMKHLGNVQLATLTKADIGDYIEKRIL